MNGFEASLTAPLASMKEPGDVHDTLSSVPGLSEVASDVVDE